MNNFTNFNFWRSGIASLVGIVFFVFFTSFFRTVPDVGDFFFVVIGILIALVPALLWLSFFYLQDRKEPEPKRIVFRVFIFGAIIASGAGMRIVNDFFHVGEWGQEPAWLRLLILILIVGFTQEILKFFIVRYTVFPTDEFNGRLDGIIYGVAAGLGYATALNLDYVISNQGVIPFVGSIRMVDNALAQASFTAVSCYFLAGARYGNRPVWWVPAGLTIASILNGVVAFIRQEVTIQGLTYKPLNALFLALVFIIITLGVLFAIMRRADIQTQAQD